ncbi:DUF645 domain-containing protein [Vibrio mimicus]|uniref:DUF645 domain-containing protein n=1 Tax=Vibrio mimicus TaxID=674 RepID=A0A2J9VJ08_VIBMI|nr:DUF645 domain-containing protein [Vibrio mimicus]
MVERAESSAVSKLLKVTKPRCFNVVGCFTRKVWFHKGCIISESVLSLSRTLNCGQLSLDRFKFWQPTSQLLALAVRLLDAFV